MMVCFGVLSACGMLRKDADSGCLLFRLSPVGCCCSCYCCWARLRLDVRAETKKKIMSNVRAKFLLLNYRWQFCTYCAVTEFMPVHVTSALWPMAEWRRRDMPASGQRPCPVVTYYIEAALAARRMTLDSCGRQLATSFDLLITAISFSCCAVAAADVAAVSLSCHHLTICESVSSARGWVFNRLLGM